MGFQPTRQAGVRAAGVLVTLGLLVGCAQQSVPTPAWMLVPPWTGEGPAPTGVPTPSSTPHPVSLLLPPTRMPGQPYATPTPDVIRPTPALRTETEYHTVQFGDTLNRIAYAYSVGVSQIMAANGIANPDVLSVGQVLVIPPPSGELSGPAFKIIPDSEAIYGPASALLDVQQFVSERGGYLSRYSGEAEGRLLSGAQIVMLVAQWYSVNPRLLLSLLEYQSHWVTRPDVPAETLVYPMGFVRAGYEGLYSQLAWAADALNEGFYAWRAGWEGPFLLADGQVILPGAGINAGTAAVGWLFSQLYGSTQWPGAVGENGLYQAYVNLFGIPFDLAVEPLLPPDLRQPVLQLPFEAGTVWSFTGGPHSAWGTGAAWGGLDFAPPGEALGCVLSNAWVVAAADGVILRSEDGQVIQDLDGDGLEQTGWVLLYLHIETRDRVQAGAVVRAGDRIGHPSCEGGVSSGTHVHLARKYNGEWIPADSWLPFNLDGWVSAGLGWMYDGTLSRAGVVLEACSCRFPGNQIGR